MMLTSFNTLARKFKTLAKGNKRKNTYCSFVKINGSLAKQLGSIGWSKVGKNAYVAPSKRVGVRYKPTHEKGIYKIQMGFTTKGLLAYRGISLLHNHGTNKLMVEEIKSQHDGKYLVTGTLHAEATSRFFHHSSTKTSDRENYSICLTKGQITGRYADLATF